MNLDKKLSFRTALDIQEEIMRLTGLGSKGYPQLNDGSALPINLCSSCWLFNLLQNESSNVLILDCRSVMRHLMSHIDHELQNQSNINFPAVDYFYHEDSADPIQSLFEDLKQ